MRFQTYFLNKLSLTFTPNVKSFFFGDQCLFVYHFLWKTERQTRTRTEMGCFWFFCSDPFVCPFFLSKLSGFFTSSHHLNFWVRWTTAVFFGLHASPDFKTTAPKNSCFLCFSSDSMTQRLAGFFFFSHTDGLQTSAGLVFWKCLLTWSEANFHLLTHSLFLCTVQ